LTWPGCNRPIDERHPAARIPRIDFRYPNQDIQAIVNVFNITINVVNAKYQPRIAFRFGLFVFGLLATAGGFVHGSPTQQSHKEFLQAEAALRAGRFDEFNRLLKRLDHSPLYAYLRYQELSKTLPDQAVAAYLDRYDGSFYAMRLRKQYVARLAGSKQWRKFVEYYRESDSVGLQCNYYRALYYTGRTSEALRGAKTLWLAGESRPDECDDLFDLLRRSPLFTSDLAWQRFALALEKGHEGLAKYLLRFLAKDDRAIADRALAVHRDPGIINACGGRSIGRRDGWIFAHGIERMADKDFARAVSVWDRLSARYSMDAETRHRVKRRLAVLAALRRDPTAYSRFVELDPKFTDQDSRFWRIRAALTTKNWDRVRESIDRLPTTEKVQISWKYWLARAYQAQEKTDQARNLFLEIAKERDYYGFLAADRMGVDYRISDRPAGLDAAELARLEATPQVRLIRELLWLGRDTEARRNWWYMLDRLSQREKSLAAKIAQNWGLRKEAVLTAAKAEYWDDLSLRFPVLFTQPIIENARTNNLSPTMIFSLVRQESIFDENAVSPAGAVGLMQIMPATGRRIATEIRDSWRSHQKLFDPATNVRYGTHYLKSLLDTFDHNFALAAAAYNAGPGRVQRWLPAGGPLESDIWVETIPYRETRNYVRYVLGYTVIYQERLGSGRTRLRDHMPTVAPGNAVANIDLPLRAERSCH
jgi:soluble lytic murein transglycosylase